MNNLIIAPHPDDEVLGCFSFLKFANVYYLTTRHPLFPDGDNIKEMDLLNDRFDVNRFVSRISTSHTNRLDNLSISVIIDNLESMINEIKPDTVLIPNPSYNQDHRVIYDAALTATRHHDRNHFVKRILLYEQPETWDTMRKPAPFQANYFRKIDVLAKIDAIKTYKSQIREHRSCDYIKAIAEIRGQQANVDYAEAFEVVRWVE